MPSFDSTFETNNEVAVAPAAEPLPPAPPAATTTISRWDDLDMDPNILRGIYGYGFETPSPIQSQAILPVIQGRDLIAQAQSGTGKTATFTIGALARIDFTSPKTQVLVLCHTHELAQQTAQVIRGLGAFIPGLFVKTIIGGTSISQDMSEMTAKKPPQIIVGTPGRIYHMISGDRPMIRARDLSLVIIDEADELLSQGFKEQVYNIFQELGRDVQIALFSATMPPEMHEIAAKFMRQPVTITVLAEQLSLEGIRQHYIALENDGQKYDTLCDLFGHLDTSQTIIYVNSIERVNYLFDSMKRDNFAVSYIHSKMSSSEREMAISEFRKGASRTLISSDVTARGIDVQQVGVVINFDIPNNPHTYIHRIGRSGRWGRKGLAINFITRRDLDKMKDIEGFYACKISELPADF